MELEGLQRDAREVSSGTESQMRGQRSGQALCLLAPPTPLFSAPGRTRIWEGWMNLPPEPPCFLSWLLLPGCPRECQDPAFT